VPPPDNLRSSKRIKLMSIRKNALKDENAIMTVKPNRTKRGKLGKE